MYHVLLASRLLTMLTWLDGLLALAMAALLGAWATPYRAGLPREAYRWAFWVGLVFCLGWWVLLALSVSSGPREEFPQRMIAVRADALLTAALLGAETGVAGVIGLPRTWGMVSLLFGGFCALLAAGVLGLIVTKAH